MVFIYECVLAARPYSFTAAIVPILVTTALLSNHRGFSTFTEEGFVRALTMGIFVQSAANLTNTYYDYVNGIDTKDCIGGDLTLVERKLSPETVFTLAVICYFVGFVAVLPLVLSAVNSEFFYIYICGIVLSIFYTASPVGLKYVALGDVVIFLCFGPLLMQATAIMVTGNTDMSILPYSVPIGLLTEAILHANNTRDIKPDSKANITTLAIVLGHEGSYVFYQMLLVGAYVSVAAISFYLRYGALLAFITVPLAVQLCRGFIKNKMEGLVEETAKFHLPFGILLFLGVMLTDKGLAEMLLSTA